MKDSEKTDMLEWIHCWKEAGAVMARIRRDELSSIDVQQAIENLDDAFESALLHYHNRHKSGLIELQAWLARTHL